MFADKLMGKIGSVFTSTGSQHGGQESTLLTFHPVLFHLGMVVAGLPYSFKGQMAMDQITGGTPYGATTIADEGERQPSANELKPSGEPQGLIMQMSNVGLLAGPPLIAAAVTSSGQWESSLPVMFAAAAAVFICGQAVNRHERRFALAAAAP